MEETIFDKILSGELPADKVYEDDDILAFKDINSQAPVHVLVIPKARMVSFKDIANAKDSTVATLFKKASMVAKKLNLEEEGYRVVMNTGNNGGQTVEYLHLHILGGRLMCWPPG